MPGSSGTTRRRPLPHVAEQRVELSAEAQAELAEKASKQERLLLIRRLRMLVILFGVFILVVLAQLLLTQVLKLTNPPQRVVAQTIDTSRGRIVDRDGVLLATDAFTWEIYLDPRRYNPENFTSEMVAQAAKELQLGPNVIMEALGNKGAVAQVAKNVTRQQCLAADESRGSAGMVLVRRQAQAHLPPGEPGGTCDWFLKSRPNWPGRPRSLLQRLAAHIG